MSEKATYIGEGRAEATAGRFPHDVRVERKSDKTPGDPWGR
jgi:hypothetical protein